MPFSPDDTIDISYVKDVARAHALAIYVPKLLHSAYNVMSGNFSISQLAEAIRKVVPEAKIELGGKEARAQTHTPVPGKFDISLAERDLGYKPSFTLEQMMREVIEYYRK